MDIEGLIKNLQALEDILKSKTLRESESLNDLSSSLERFEAALSDLRVVTKSAAVIDPGKLKPIIESLGEAVSELDKLCGDKLNLLSFVSDITPIKEV